MSSLIIIIIIIIIILILLFNCVLYKLIAGDTTLVHENKSIISSIDALQQIYMDLYKTKNYIITNLDETFKKFNSFENVIKYDIETFAYIINTINKAQTICMSDYKEPKSFLPLNIIECLILLLNDNQKIIINSYIGRGQYNMVFDITLININDKTNTNCILRCGYISYDCDYGFSDEEDKDFTYQNQYNMLKLIFENDKNNKYTPIVYNGSIKYNHNFIPDDKLMYRYKSRYSKKPEYQQYQKTTYWWFIVEKINEINIKYIIENDFINFLKRLEEICNFYKQFNILYYDLHPGNIGYSNITKNYVIIDFEGYYYEPDETIDDSIKQCLYELCKFMIDKYIFPYKIDLVPFNIKDITFKDGIIQLLEHIQNKLNNIVFNYDLNELNKLLKRYNIDNNVIHI